MQSFYKKFKIVSNFPLWTSYLKWVYKQSFQDSKKMGVLPFKNEAPIFLLCGVSGEITANEFIAFALSKYPKASITVIDLGRDQIKSVKKLVKDNYPEANIKIKRANALNLNFIKNNSIDWIDTDGFFSFFDEKQLQNLFQEWKRILNKDGFITFRELTSGQFLFTLANKTRAKLSKLYMNIPLHLHTSKQLERYMGQEKFKFSRGKTPALFLERYCLVNQ